MKFSEYCTSLERYYQALNEQNEDKYLNFLTTDVKVTFLNTEKNWAGIDQAKIKFENMYKQNPNFYGEIMNIDTVSELNSFVIILITAFFGNKEESKETKESKSKKMRYTFDLNFKIKQIDHL